MTISSIVAMSSRRSQIMTRSPVVGTFGRNRERPELAGCDADVTHEELAEPGGFPEAQQSSDRIGGAVGTGE
jgi:hypothetical protein